MYQLRFNNDIFYDPRGVNRQDRLIIRDPKVKLRVNAVDSMSFAMQPDHPYLHKLTRMRGVVELRQSGHAIYRGRITSDLSNFYTEPTVRTEGLLACLNDSYVEPFIFPDDFLDDPAYQEAAENGNVVEYLVRWLFERHNSQVGPEQQLYLGTVTVSDTNNYVFRELERVSKTWHVFKEKLFGSELGGYVVTRYEDDGTYVDYLAELPLTNVQTVEFAKNLLDLSKAVEAAGIYTAIYPIGKEGLTIRDLPDGEIGGDLIKSGCIIYSKSAEDQLGSRITNVVDFSDVTLAENLRDKGVRQLGTGMAMPETIRCKACDLHMVSGDIQAFRVGRLVRVISKPHDIEELYPLMTLEPDIFAPENTVLDLGETRNTLTGSLNVANRHLSSKADHAIASTALLKEETSEQLNSIRTSLQEQHTELINTSEEIVMRALESYVESSSYEEFRQSMESQLTLLADQMNLSFSKTEEQIVNAAGDLQKQINTITTHFTFDVNGLTIGKANNPNKVVIDNDDISILVNNTEVQRFDSSGKSLIPELTITRLLNMLGYQIGKDGSGNVNCEYVGD